MAATLDIVKITGPSAAKVETVITTLSLGTKDIADPLQAGTSDFFPIARPTSGFAYSYWSNVALKASGTFTDIRNIRWFTSIDPAWNLGTGGAKLIGNRDSGDIGASSTDYAQASGTENETGTYLADSVSGHTFYRAQVAPVKNWGDFTSAAPATVDSTFYTAPFTSKHVVMQVKVAPDADFALMTGGEFKFRAQVVN